MSSRLAAGLALLLSLGLALFATRPAWVAPSSWMIGNWYHPDCLSNHWLLVWVAEQLSQGQSILHNDRYYWPVGDAPVLAGNGAEGVAYLPFHLLLGWPVGVLGYTLCILTLNGLAGWALAKAAGADPYAALLAAAVTGGSPYAYQELSSGRFAQVSLCWMLFFLASWLRFLSEPTLRRAVGSAALLAAASFFYWYYGFFCVIAGAILLGGAAVARRLPPVRLLAIFSASYLALIGPWLWVFATHWGAVVGTEETTSFPHPEALNEAYALVWPFWVREGHLMAHAQALPVFLLALAGVGLALRGGWVARSLVVTGAVFYGLSLGPTGKFAPYTLLYGLAEPLRRFWWPIRHEALAQGVWAALAALALSAVVVRFRPAIRGVVGLLVALCCPVALALQGARTDVTVSELSVPPAVYPKIAMLDGKGLVEPPLSPEVAGAQQQLLYQLYHGKTLITGHAMWVERVRPPAWDAFVAKNSFLRGLQQLERGKLSGTFSFDGADLRALLDADFRWFSVNREAFPLPFRDLVDSYQALFTGLFGQPVQRGSGIWIWDGEKWTGATELPLKVYTWPPGIAPGGPSQRVGGRRPKSLSFGKGRGGRPLPGEF